MAKNLQPHQVKCTFCQELKTIRLDIRDYERWRAQRTMIQHELPYLSADERELLLSGTCADCSTKLFGNE